MQKQINTKPARIIFLLLIVLTALSACTNSKKASEGAGRFTRLFGLAEYKMKVTMIPSGKIYFTRTKAYVNGNNLYINGHIRTRYNVPVVGGHVDIKVFDPDDVELYKTTVYQRPKSIRKSKAQDVSKFKVTVAQRPPEGSRVELWFHRERKKLAPPHK